MNAWYAAAWDADIKHELFPRTIISTKRFTAIDFETTAGGEFERQGVRVNIVVRTVVQTYAHAFDGEASQRTVLHCFFEAFLNFL